jgi:hypothetical protein
LKRNHIDRSEDIAILSDIDLFFLVALRGSAMVVKSLCHELQSKRVPLSRRLLDLGALVLEPDLDLRLREAQLRRQRLPPPLRQVAVLGEFVLRANIPLASRRYSLI